jgi:hypothetical protein
MKPITANDVAAGTVKHWHDSLTKTSRSQIDYKLVIPSFDRPTELCGNTLSLLRREGVPLDKVNVFVSPSSAMPGGTPEWYRYVEECKTHHFPEVHIRPGGRTLEAQMVAAMEWVGSGYMVVMSDTVRSIQTREDKPNCTTRMVPAPQGTVLALIKHGFELLRATGSTAWSVNPSHNPWQLSVSTITRRLGLLDGNLMGMFLPPNWKQMQVTSGHGLIYDVEWSAALWSQGHTFCRYQGVCCEHTYRRPGGQATLMNDVTKRRLRETQAIKACAKKYPSLVKWCSKPKASLRTMEYKFSPQGPSGLVMEKARGGARREYSLSEKSTSAQRMARMRQRDKRRK